MKTFREYFDVAEAINYHIRHDVPLSENVYRMHSDGFYQFFVEARKMYRDGTLVPSNDFDLELLESDIGEFADYQGERVPLDAPFSIEESKEGVELNKPKRGGSKKFFVYVKDGDSIKKISFGHKGSPSTGKTLSVKINDPVARKSFAARHKCSTQKDKTSPAYWSCRLPYFAKSLGLTGGGNYFW